MGKDEHDRVQKEYFNRICFEWNKTFDGKRKEIDAMMSEFCLKGDERILDVATGIGVLMPSYEKLLTTGTVRGIDYTTNMIKLAKERFPHESHPNISFEVMDIYDMNSVSEYDAVVCYSCFPHFNDHEKAVSIFANVLKPYGKFIVCSLKSDHDSVMANVEIDPDMPEHRFIKIHDLISLMAKYGIELWYVNNKDDFSLVIGMKKDENVS